MAILGLRTLNGLLQLELDNSPIVDPIVAGIGSQAYWNDSGIGRVYLKTGSASNAWTEQPVAGFAAAASAAAPVQTVFGRSGAVSATTNDYTWAQINKATSSLLDITTRSAADLSSGTLLAARLPAFTGDVTSSIGTIALTLATSGVVAGTYTKITVDAKGRATVGASLASADVTTALGFSPVQSVFGRTGVVVAASNDYTWAQINKATSSFADITTRSATDINSGTLADARLSSNVALKNINNNFSAIQTISISGSSSTLNIDCAGSQANPGLLLFTNSGGTGDFRIGSDGGDIGWQGGGGRALQMFAFHQVDIIGGRNTATALAYLNGSNGTYNTRILNSNAAQLGLVLRGFTAQSGDMLQVRSSAEAVLAGISAAGNAYGQDPVNANHYTTKNYVDTQINVWTELITTADLTNSSNFTPTSVNELSIPVTAGNTYRYEATLIYESSSATTGLAVTIDTTDTAVGTISMTARMMIAADGTAAEYAGAITTLGDLVIGTDVPATGTRYVCTIIGIFICTTGGTIRPRFRREATGAGTITLRTGSCLLSRQF